ncbi:MAG: sulfatase-like hydrolase/transferase [Bacteroidota bacterium]
MSCFNSCNAPKNSHSPPNILIIYVDDMGIGDAQFSGGKSISTPNLDRLAQNGKVFTQYYTTAPVCSPSRVSVTTGMYHIRWGINTYLAKREKNRLCEQSNYLASTAPTLARSLKEAGYRTAHFGKWHMGGGRDVDNAPPITSYGFDAYSSTWESPDPDPLLTSSNWIWAPTDSIKRWERTAYFIDRTLAFFKENAGQPIFVNLWPDDVHTPWVGSEEAQSQPRETFFSQENLEPVMQEMDKEIGRLEEGLKALGVWENTLLVFTSDNGPRPSFDQLRTNELRGEKNSLYEGGVRMPFFVHWPAKIKGGQIDTSSLIASIDLHPTLCALASVETVSADPLDGENIEKAIIGPQSYKRNKPLFYEFGRNSHYIFPIDSIHRSPQLAIREGKWKLLANPNGSQVALYNLELDPQESRNLSEDEPSRVKSLQTSLIDWYTVNDKEQLRQQK